MIETDYSSIWVSDANFVRVNWTRVSVLVWTMIVYLGLITQVYQLTTLY